MTDALQNQSPAAWPLPLILTRQESEGAQAQGCVVARSELAQIADRMGARSQRYAALRLTLGETDAVFWSTQPVDLPWLPVSCMYLQPPSNQIFLPIGWVHNAAEGMLDSLLSDLSPGPKAVKPMALLPRLPDSNVSTIRILELADSLSVAAVDWAFLARDQA